MLTAPGGVAERGMAHSYGFWTGLMACKYKPTMVNFTVKASEFLCFGTGASFLGGAAVLLKTLSRLLGSYPGISLLILLHELMVGFAVGC